MGDRSNIGGGLGLVAAVAVVSTGIILASYHLHRRLGTDPKTDITGELYVFIHCWLAALVRERNRLINFLSCKILTVLPSSLTGATQLMRAEQRRQRKKKVRFADEVMVANPLSVLREEYRRRRRAAANGPIRPALRKA